MKVLSLLPPGLRGDSRGWGRRVAVFEEVVEDAGGDRIKPPPSIVAETFGPGRLQMYVVD